MVLTLSLCSRSAFLSVPLPLSPLFCPLFLDHSDGLYTYKGSDAPEQTEDGRPGENKFVKNNILGTVVGVKMKEADNTEITGEGRVDRSPTLLELQSRFGDNWGQLT